MTRKKLKIKETVIVEGRYDKNTLSQIVDANIIACNGFQVFQNTETRNYILSTAKETGIIILTDADASGFMIRSAIHGFVPGELLMDAYVPAIPGKEKRKDAPGKEGLLGVEGMTPEILLQALKDAGATFADEDPGKHEVRTEKTKRPETAANPKEDFITGSEKDCEAGSEIEYKKNREESCEEHIEADMNPGESPIRVADLYALGLTGRPDSSQKKKQLLKKLDLPSYLNNRELLAVLNRRMSLQELSEIMIDF